MSLLFRALLFVELRQLRGEDGETWWEEGSTQINVWDHSWLTPRLVCGLRFLRVPPRALREGGVFLPLNATAAESHLMWVFDGTAFQDKALRYYGEKGRPPLEEVWLLELVMAVPRTMKHDVLSGSSLMERLDSLPKATE